MAAVLSAEGASGEKPGVERSGISANLLQQREGAITHLSRRDQSEGGLARSAGKKKKDASSPVGTVSLGLVRQINRPSGTGLLLSCYQALRARLLSFGPSGTGCTLS